MPRVERRFFGVVEVDSGTLLVGDPTYVLPRKETGHEAVDYAEVIAADHSQSDAIRLAEGPTLLISNFGGDGTFPVFGEYEDGELMRVVVEFVEPDEV